MKQKQEHKFLTCHRGKYQLTQRKRMDKASSLRDTATLLFGLWIKRITCWCHTSTVQVTCYFGPDRHKMKRINALIIPGSALLEGCVCCWLWGGGRSSMIFTKLRGKIPVKAPRFPRAQSSPMYSFSWITSPSENDSSSLCSPSKSNLATHRGPLHRTHNHFQR